ncbi:MAG: HEAT repeat domain-containing protein, partial [Chloroflexi bacterium]|nr:HEAT repeat domain-containing protein [Chloroflexota bacterium]
MTRDLSPYIKILQDPAQEIDYLQITPFSDLNSAELMQFRAGWATLTPGRQLEVLRVMVQVTEDYFEYDFGKIFAGLLHEPDPQIRLLAIEGLLEDDRPQLIPEICKLLETDSDPEVRAAAAGSLGRFIYAASIELIGERSVAAAKALLRTCYTDPHEALLVRRRALESLAASYEDDIDVLIESAYYADDADMYLSALFAMGRNGDRRWVPYLAEGLSHEIAELRLEAMRALGEIGDRESAMHIVQLLHRETDSEVRLAAIMALGRIGGDKAQEALNWLLTWEDEEIDAAVALALEEHALSDTSVIGIIDEILAEEGEEAIHDDEIWDDPLDAEIRRLYDE